MMRTRSLCPDPAVRSALGWRALRLGGRDSYWHDAHEAPEFSNDVAPDPTHIRPRYRRRGRR